MGNHPRPRQGFPQEVIDARDSCRFEAIKASLPCRSSTFLLVEKQAARDAATVDDPCSKQSAVLSCRDRGSICWHDTSSMLVCMRSFFSLASVSRWTCCVRNKHGRSNSKPLSGDWSSFVVISQSENSSGSAEQRELVRGNTSGVERWLHRVQLVFQPVKKC